jgi:hypothetical protein
MAQTRKAKPREDVPEKANAQEQTELLQADPVTGATVQASTSSPEPNVESREEATEILSAEGDADLVEFEEGEVVSLRWPGSEGRTLAPGTIAQDLLDAGYERA